ncbi:hypothetical protein ZYGR_0U00700 [Zygosaccharomyces rouxii]|uniref:ZYRO0F10296p n=2 Tax=Zygosaccharomyces rouxii TaxID=4956 RepID=C5DY51_ZYGRC|nr:uncharacterized protein ZYRO0F10296g [Zygosaccharomyces rouxii]KAH9199470.1 aspartic peptidase domain-containing protein [Zygosaccharomyces rouxii]GAV50214.1 hypothetical protein ZYGR_0U00700 [Zygosaccharomyces rouxii]CAR28712.1 ZYRO0F10296p [Zygosaccharomyces rouxii]
MKFAKGLYVCGLVSSVSCLPAVHDSRSSQSVAKIGFNKVYGKSFSEATADRKYVNLFRNKNISDDNDEVALQNNANTYYSVNISLGTPGQNMTIQLDTGSSDLWVIKPGGLQCTDNDTNLFKKRSENDNDNDAISSFISQLESYEGSFSTLFGPGPGSVGTPTGTISSSMPAPTGNGSYDGGDSDSDGSNNCNATAFFEADNSKTFHRNRTDPYYIQYEDLSYASGYWGTDDLQLGDLQVHNVSFAVANDTNSTTPVFGIGFPGGESSFASVGPEYRAAHPHEYANFPQTLKNQGIIQRVAYSLYLNSPNSTYGNVLFGGVDHSQYQGQLYTLPILQLGNLTSDGDPYNTLAITLQGVSVTRRGSKHKVKTKPIPVVLDSGTTAMYLPYKLAKSIASRYHGILGPEDQGYIIDCPKSGDNDYITFDFGGVTIKTDIRNYIFEQSENKCLLGIIPNSDILAVFGDVFLTDAYVVYDLEGKEISLAQASFNSSSEQIEAITSSGVPGAKRAPGYSKTWKVVHSSQASALH